MATVKVTAPTKFTGDRVGVHFRDGHAEADTERDAAAVAYFRRRGYTVDGDQEPDADVVLERPAVRAGKPDWEAYATHLGIDPTGKSKDELIAAVDAHEQPKADGFGADDDE